MRVIGLVVGAMMVAGVAGPRAQQAGSTPTKLFTSSADITAMIAKAKAERKPDQANFSQSIVALDPYRVNLQYRTQAEKGGGAHETDAELFYVFDGGGTMLAGDTSRHVGKGDFILVPEKSKHGWTAVDGVVVYMTLHLPHATQPPTGSAEQRPPKLFSSAADITAMEAKAKTDRKPDEANYSQPIVLLPPAPGYRGNLEYRAVTGPSAVHEDAAELFIVLDGSATMVTGGTLKGTTIEGGMSRRVSKGDFIIVPEHTPHGFSAIESTLAQLTLHLPRPLKP